MAMADIIIQELKAQNAAKDAQYQELKAQNAAKDAQII
jgi:hypothetical protein